jgi:hypothetical protein
MPVERRPLLVKIPVSFFIEAGSSLQNEGEVHFIAKVRV